MSKFHLTINVSLSEDHQDTFPKGELERLGKFVQNMLDNISINGITYDKESFKTHVVGVVGNISVIVQLMYDTMGREYLLKQLLPLRNMYKDIYNIGFITENIPEPKKEVVPKYSQSDLSYVSNILFSNRDKVHDFEGKINHIRTYERLLRNGDTHIPEFESYERNIDLIMCERVVAEAMDEKQRKARIIKEDDPFQINKPKFGNSDSTTVPPIRDFKKFRATFDGSFYLLERVVYELNYIIQCHDGSSQCDYKANVLTKYVDAFMNGHDNMTCYKNITEEEFNLLEKEARKILKL